MICGNQAQIALALGVAKKLKGKAHDPTRE
jgi:hypothetical protein